ncbi:MAG: hypothetical protein J6V24_05435, partial [Clostridia bacterium]|nr:hypothetical protein [Clostridia bacterium]
ANLAREYGLTPGGVYRERIWDLQARLMEAGCFLPGMRRTMPAWLLDAELILPGTDALRNGADRTNHTYGEGDQGVRVRLGEAVGYRFREPVRIANVHLALDSDLARASLPGDDCERRHSMRANVFEDGSGKSPEMTMPAPLVKAYRIEGITEAGERIVLAEEENNLRQCVNVPADCALRELTFTPLSLWGGGDEAHILSFDAR